METHQPREGGGTAAFRELFDGYYAPLCRFAACWFHDGTSAHIWQHAGELRISTSVRAYLFRAVRNRALNRLRDERTDGIPIGKGPEPLFTNPEALQLEADEMLLLIAEAVSQLPDRCREVFRKSREEGLSNAAIANQMRISVKTVEAQITKALRRIRETLLRT